jgi:acyl-CoA thioester hydrolase
MATVSESMIRVRYQETDQMGVVYHANYLVWFEIGRTDFIRQLGVTYAELETKGLLLPVVEANCKYRRPAKYDDDIVIRTRISELKGARLTFGYEAVRKEDQLLLAEGFTMHVFTSPEFRPVNLRGTNPEVFDLLQQHV